MSLGNGRRIAITLLSSCRCQNPKKKIDFVNGFCPVFLYYFRKNAQNFLNSSMCFEKWHNFITFINKNVSYLYYVLPLQHIHLPCTLRPYGIPSGKIFTIQQEFVSYFIFIFPKSNMDPIKDFRTFLMTFPILNMFEWRVNWVKRIESVFFVVVATGNDIFVLPYSLRLIPSSLIECMAKSCHENSNSIQINDVFVPFHPIRAHIFHTFIFDKNGK